jgi:hypothetical protein
MSISPKGDRGQRYEVVSTGYPLPGEKVVCGWAERLEDAERMARSLRLAPGCTSTTIRDRFKKTPEWGELQEFTMYAGMLR